MEQNIKPEQEMSAPEEPQTEGVETQEPEKEAKEEPKEYTVDIVIAKKSRKVRVKDIPIMWEGKPDVVTIKKFSFGERATYSESFVNIQVQGEFEKVDVSLREMQIKAIELGVHQAPFEISRDYIEHELDGEIGEKIYQEIEAYNKLGEAKKKR